MTVPSRRFHHSHLSKIPRSIPLSVDIMSFAHGPQKVGRTPIKMPTTGYPHLSTAFRELVYNFVEKGDDKCAHAQLHFSLEAISLTSPTVLSVISY